MNFRLIRKEKKTYGRYILTKQFNSGMQEIANCRDNCIKKIGTNLEGYWNMMRTPRWWSLNKESI
jgi:hypothetical protein